MRSTMFAALYRGLEEVRLEEVERPEPAPGWVQVKTRRAGICGSDLHSYFGRWELGSQAGGHEVSGVVAAVGEGVEQWAVGDRVCAECFTHCGQCRFCQTGNYNHCEQRAGFTQGHGAFAEYILVHPPSLFKLPDALTWEQGALVEPLAVGYRACRRAGVRGDDRLLILGAGTIGLCVLWAARSLGLSQVAVVAKYEQQAALAQAWGAEVLGEPDAMTAERVQEWADPEGVAGVVETVGAAANFDLALESIRPQGTVVLVAGYPGPRQVNLGPIVGKEPVVTGSACYAYTDLEKDFQAVLRLLQEGKLDATTLVTHRFPLSEVVPAFRAAADKTSGSIKVQVCLGEGTSGT